jgi:hypothetical protein
MPNWCETDLTIEGPNDYVQDIIAKYINPTGGLDLNAVIPYPARFKVLDEIASDWENTHPNQYIGRPTDGFNSGGYDWCVHNWGTKWDTCNAKGIKYFARRNRFVTRIKLSFSTAWNPASPVFTRLAEMYPAVTITAKSYEQGMAYKYVEKYVGGVQVLSEESKYAGHRGG